MNEELREYAVVDLEIAGCDPRIDVITEIDWIVVKGRLP